MNRIKLKNKIYRENKLFTIMLIPNSNGRPCKKIISYYAIHTALLFSLFLLIMCASFYFIAQNYKLRSVNAVNDLQEIKQINNELVKREEKLNGVIQNEQNRFKQIEDMISKEYEEKINYYEEKTLELQWRLEELNKQKDEISEIISATILPDGESYADNGTEQVLSVAEEINVSTGSAAMGGPVAEDMLNWKISMLESDILNQEKKYKELIELVNTSAISGEGVRLALSKGISRENIPTIMPVSGKLTSLYGKRLNPFGGAEVEGHNGIDIAVSTGTPVLAAGGGQVKFSGMYGSYGNLVIIDHGNGLESYYGHNSTLKVFKGETVKRGQVISLSGNTGRSTGPHVHFEIRLASVVKDPMDFVNKNN